MESITNKGRASDAAKLISKQPNKEQIVPAEINNK